MQKSLVRSVATLGGIAMLTLSSIASAALVKVDFLTTGDGLLTLDTATNLEWLNLTVTLGQSFNQIMASPYVENDGFQFATETQLRSLYAAVGITQTGEYPSQSNSLANA